MKRIEARQQRILYLVEQMRCMTIRDLAIELDVSEMTVRRDVEKLDAENKVRYIHGAVLSNSNIDREDNTNTENADSEAESHRDEKKRIAKYAAGMIRNGDTVILDGGATNEMLAEYINPGLEISVYIWHLNILNKLLDLPNIALYPCGGKYHRENMFMSGPTSYDKLYNVGADKVFISTDAVQQCIGVMYSHECEKVLKKAIATAGKTKILLADSSKFGMTAQFLHCDIEDLDIIITDRELPPSWDGFLRTKNVKLIRV